MSDTEKINFVDEEKQVVYKNGLFVQRPSYMSQSYWERYEAPRVGKVYGKKGSVYGEDFPEPTFGNEEMEDGCGGACAI